MPVDQPGPWLSSKIAFCHIETAVMQSAVLGSPLCCSRTLHRLPSIAQYDKQPVRKCARSSQCRVRAHGGYSTAVPDSLATELRRSNQLWLQEALQAPLVPHDSADCVIYILGVACWGPLQHDLVEQALHHLRPDEVLVDQPQTTSELLLPHPQWIQSILDHQQCLHPGQQQGQQWQQHVQSLAAELSSSMPAAKVGKDIMDPFESFGYYSGLDYFKQPGSLAEVLQLCGYLPGQEVVAAAQYALAHGVHLRCIDAPLKLQESWVRNLVSNFSAALDEQAINSYTPMRDFNDNQQVASTLPPAAAAWDKQLAAAAAQLQQQAASQPGDAAAGRPPSAEQQAAERQALLLFKVAKATAAALLPPEPAQQAEVLARMARLQPLKWRHFALRQQYMAEQVKEFAGKAAKQAQQDRKPKLLVIMARQHAAAMRALWFDPKSSLWRTQVPRSFAPSVVEPADAAGSGAAAGTAA